MVKATVAAPKKEMKPTGSRSALHPPYIQMICEAISTLKERTGSSKPAIEKFMEEKYFKTLPPNFRKVLAVQLKKFVKSERLMKVKNSYKISSTEKLKMAVKEVRKKKSTASRKATPPKDKGTKKKASEKGVKTKRLSHVKTPETLKKAKKDAGKRVHATKVKRLSQVKTPEGLKRKNATPMKRKNSKPAGNGARPTKKAKK